MQNFDFESTLKSPLSASFSTDIPAIAKSSLAHFDSGAYISHVQSALKVKILHQYA